MQLACKQLNPSACPIILFQHKNKKKGQRTTQMWKYPPIANVILAENYMHKLPYGTHLQQKACVDL